MITSKAIGRRRPVAEASAATGDASSAAAAKRAAPVGHAGIGALWASLETDGLAVRTRRRQRLAVAIDGETVYVVRSGVLALSTSAAGHRRQILSVLFPGDVFRSAFAPPLPEIALTALTSGEVVRLRWPVIERRLACEPELSALFTQRVAERQARDAMHIATISGLSGEQRVASFLIEIALRLGRPGAGGYAFELPLSRADIADYLALNPDTLSRIMSRLKAKGLITLHKRGHALARSFEALCRESPIADALVEMDRQARAAG
ncbi:MAG: Crp/Fnr family transcriptional regulator [Pseudomonadota bacterium]